MKVYEKVSGGAMPPFEAGTLRGIIRYLDKAGVQHLYETSSVIKDLETAKRQLSIVRKALEAKGYTIEKEDIVDMLETVAGGSPETLRDIWKGVTSNAKDIVGILKYMDDDGILKTYRSPAGITRKEALEDLTAFIKKNGLKKWASAYTSDLELEDILELEGVKDILKDSIVK